MLKSAEFYVQRQIKEAGGLPEIEEAIKLIQAYAEPQYAYYKSKNLRLDEWNPDKGEIYELVLATFTITLQNDSLTYQAIAGMLASRIGVNDHIDQVKIAAEIIALINRTGLINAECSGSGQYTMISTNYCVDNNWPEPEKHKILMDKPKEVTSNYSSDNESLILGGRHNHHEGNICLDHLNRMNSIQLKLNKPYLRKYEEAPTFALDTQEKREQWDNFIVNSYRSYIHLAQNGNRFYLFHKYDKRGRTYSNGYHINTQGSKFKKSITQLAKVELVEG